MRLEVLKNALRVSAKSTENSARAQENPFAEERALINLAEN
jgi:hypothetical protein